MISRRTLLSGILGLPAAIAGAVVAVKNPAKSKAKPLAWGLPAGYKPQTFRAFGPEDTPVLEQMLADVKRQRELLESDPDWIKINKGDWITIGSDGKIKKIGKPGDPRSPYL